MEVELGGTKVKVSKMVHMLRTELMMEHFGVSYDKIKDPVASRNLLYEVAEKNSQVFFEIFKCEPDNNIHTFEQLAEVRRIRE